MLREIWFLIKYSFKEKFVIADAVEYMEYGDEVDNDIKYIHKEIDRILQQAVVPKYDK